MICCYHAYILQSVLNPSCPVKVQSNEEQNLNQRRKSKEKSKNESVKRLRCIRAIRERFLILSSVAAGLQSVMQQYCLTTYILLEYEYR